ncbi:hypothetical protein [Paraburkholderia fungorum]|uniref:hypothetical protein n=1 Tax=Paraburkholderia fungorum TaxID=134537 RepID=UPI0038B82985
MALLENRQAATDDRPKVLKVSRKVADKTSVLNDKPFAPQAFELANANERLVGLVSCDTDCTILSLLLYDFVLSQQ